MIQQQRLIVTFINVFTHFTKLCFFKAYENLRFSNFPLYPRGRASGNSFRLKGIVQFTGSFNGLSFYELNGKIVVRKTGGFDGGKIKKVLIMLV
jgi:hypothetical protein